MNYKTLNELLADADKCLGKEITLVKEAFNKEQERKKFKLVGYYERGTGEVNAPVSYNGDDYSWGAWGYLLAEDGQEINRFSLELILNVIRSGKELEYNY